MSPSAFIARVLHNENGWASKTLEEAIAMDSIFTITNDALSRLNAEEAVARFGDLLRAEARRLGIPISKVNISNWINISDGGIDASVDETVGLSHNDLIKAGRVGYQIKADSSFFQTHHSWSVNDDMKGEFVVGAQQHDLIPSILDNLRQISEYTHIRICGDPGIGKTRLALESTNIDDISPLVLYCDNARRFIESGLIAVLRG